MKNLCKVLLALGTVMLNPASAADMKIKTGLWEFRSQMSMPGGPAVPRERVNQQCIEDASMSPQTLMKDMNQGCKLVDSKSSGSSMEWTVTCANPGGEMAGKGQVESRGDTLTGSMEMQMSMQGQQMNMRMQWDGRYLGACQ